MSNKQHKPQEAVNNIQKLNIIIDYDKLSDAIVRAQKIAEEKAFQKEEAEFEEWKLNIGLKSHEDKKGLKRKIYVFCNSIKVILKLIFFPKKYRV